MAAAATSAPTRVSRCAVCKIDRKGRFVYLDEETERLLGLSQVELFAKPFAEFLDPADHEVIDEITSQFNRYESFYDAAPVTIIDSHGQRIAATVVVSLNFAAGNPVNYEIIINTAGQPGPTRNQPSENNGSQEYLSFLRDVRLPSDSPAAASDVVEALRVYTGAQTVELYETSGEVSHLVASAGQQSADDSARQTDHSDTEEASLHCYRTVLDLSQEEEYLLKVAFDESWSDDQLEPALDRAELAAALLVKTLATSGEVVPEYTSADTFSLIDLLGKMQIGAALFDSEGHLVDQNEKLRGLLAMDTVSCLADFSQRLAEAGEPDTEAHIRAYFEASDSTKSPPNLELPVRLSSGQPADLTIFRLAPGSEDQSAYCILSPVDARGQQRAGEPLPLSRGFIREAIEQLRSSISAGLSMSQKLDHEHHSELKRDGGFYLNCLSNHLHKAGTSLDELSSAASFALDPDRPSPTDLGLLVDQILPEIAEAYPQVKLSMKKSGMPKVTISRKKIRTILKNVLTHLVANAVGSTVGINIRATVNTKVCHLRIKCEGAAIPQKHLDHPFDPAGMGVTCELVTILGGQLELAKSRGRGSVLTIALPIEEV